jgi:hypothetical protein
MVQLAQTQFGGLQILSPTATNYEEIEAVVFDVLSKGQNVRTAEDAKAYMSELEDDCVMNPLHSDAKPIIIDQSYCALLWENPDAKGNPDYMAGVIFMLVNIDGKDKFEPAAIIVGDEFEGVFQYRDGCCGGLSQEDKSSAYSMLVFVSQNNQINHKILDTPVTRSECLQKFAKLPHGIKVSSHDIKHMLHHHQHGHDHECGHDHKNLPKAKI